MKIEQKIQNIQNIYDVIEPTFQESLTIQHCCESDWNVYLSNPTQYKCKICWRMYR